MKATQFYVYLHKRPDGSVFYVGKGTKTRAYEFCPSRRTKHHSSIVAKYGRENIQVDLIPVSTEKDAFELEKILIKVCRTKGDRLANITDGGEGASGRKFTPQQLEAHREAVKRGWDTRGRKPPVEKHPLQPRVVYCAMCGEAVVSISPKRKFCSDTCTQRHARSLVPKQPTKDYSNNTTGRKGVYRTKQGAWIAAIGINNKLVHLGTFKSKDAAAEARAAAEAARG